MIEVLQSAYKFFLVVIMLKLLLRDQLYTLLPQRKSLGKHFFVEETHADGRFLSFSIVLKQTLNLFELQIQLSEVRAGRYAYNMIDFLVFAFDFLVINHSFLLDEIDNSLFILDELLSYLFEPTRVGAIDNPQDILKNEFGFLMVLCISFDD